MCSLFTNRGIHRETLLPGSENTARKPGAMIVEVVIVAGLDWLVNVVIYIPFAILDAGLDYDD